MNHDRDGDGRHADPARPADADTGTGTARPRHEPVRPGRLEWREGLPFAPEFGDLYRSAHGALGEARHVFVAGCRLPEAWAGRGDWTILELGFGLGVNFLATLAQWRDDPRRPPRLHYVGIERHPLAQADLRAALAALAVPTTLSEPLAARWPPLAAGLHRLELDDGRVTLTLALGDAGWLLPRLDLSCDSLYLDGFAPARNPRLWAPEVLHAACSKLVRDGMAATYTVAAPVRRALADAGMVVETRPGFGPKRDCVAARRRYGGRERRADRGHRAAPEREALIVGAGVAGTALARSLARRGWGVTLVSRDGDAAHPAASDQPVLAHHVSVSPDDAPISRLTRAALLLSRGAHDADAVRWTGRVQLCSPERAARLAASLPASLAVAIDAREASRRSGLPLRHGGLWLPQSGCADPRRLGERWADDARVRRVAATIARLQPDLQGWRALDADGVARAEAPVAIVAAGTAAPALAGIAGLAPRAGLQRRRDRTTIVTAPPALRLDCVVGGDGHAAPIGDGRWLLGPDRAASTGDGAYDGAHDGSGYADDGGAEPRWGTAAWRRALGWLDVATAKQLAGSPPALVPGPAGTRLSTRDHLPLIGPVPRIDAAHAPCHGKSGDVAREGPSTVPGLWISAAFGGRGLLWAVLAAEVIAARLEGEPAPLERDLLRAIDPSRFSQRKRPRSL